MLRFDFLFGLFADLDKVLNLFDNFLLGAVFVAVIIIGMWVGNVQALNIFVVGSKLRE